MQQQADSTVKFADAINLMAENDRRRNDILEMMIQNDRNILERMLENDKKRNVLLANLTELLKKSMQ